MIQEQAEELVTLIERRRTLGEHLQLLEGFRAQLQEVEQACARLEPLIVTWRLVRARGIGDVSQAGDAGLLLEQLTELQDRYVESAASILGPNRLVAVKNGVARIATSLEQQLLAKWGAYVQERIPSAPDEVLNVLNRIPALRAHVDRVSAGLRALRDTQQRLPMTEADVDAFEQKALEVRAMWDAFDTKHLPSAVLRFLKDAGSGGATLETLSPTVRQWLDEHHLTASFRIRSVPAGGPNSEAIHRAPRE